MTRPTTRTTRKRIRALLLVLAFFGSRVLYVPHHLAQEEHHVGMTVSHSHHSVDGHEGHGQQREDEDHEPHAADDHAGLLLLRRGPAPVAPADSPEFVPVVRLSPSPASAPTAGARDVVLRPPRSRISTTNWLRGPPALS